MTFEIFVPTALHIAGDRFTVKWYQDDVNVQKYDWLQTTTGGPEGTVPLTINKTIEANAPVIVEIKYDATSGSVPSGLGYCNMMGRVY